jgi:hypothetical protein
LILVRVFPFFAGQNLSVPAYQPVGYCLPKFEGELFVAG